ncbi:uncharacterized protein LOC100568919 isoform X2 [Acyrthosiphon pisum]|uniref:Uncharacterized protein n=1 Tax=Acyrthosiphon pisum TaxID=7029 RepID=A0A8R2B433_ACYPI|nr:uncharacterized protein LOC100568919 isoform X2 [Acyrthosiphon pisum]|eukprot:XP_008180840.1 PREDICTED: uncharacterized protein LOC100568919 isoform X2 [Acyrthosiphon pisum]
MLIYCSTQQLTVVTPWRSTRRRRGLFESGGVCRENERRRRRRGRAALVHYLVRFRSVWMVTKRKYPRISTDDWPACCPPCTRKANEKTGVFYRKLKFHDVEGPPTATSPHSWQEVSLPGRSSTICNP